MSDRVRILFVDDERPVLDGLVRLFRPQRHVWDVVTANSGPEALALLATAPADVVISDMRMPGMDGAELLSQVRDTLPSAVRIMLSGQTDRESAIVRAGPCHHFLAKPCDPGRLVTVVDRALALRRDLADPALAARMAMHPSLPSLPRLWRAMVAELGSVDPSLPRLSTLVEQEPATVARLLRVVNSAAFGLDRTVAAIPEAVALLGIEALRALVLAVHVHDSCAEAAGVDAEALWEHSMADARLARALTRTYGGTSAQIEAAFTAGLLHDCGRLVIASGFPQVGRASLAAVHAGDEPCAAEEAAGGPRHDLAGGWLLLRWGLPDQVVEAAAWHHHPERTPESPLVPLAAVQMADALLGEIACPARQPHEALLRCFGGAERLPGLRALADQVGRP